MYVRNLKFLMLLLHKWQYNKHHLQTGIIGLSILLGLQPEKILGIPKCFSFEIMHYVGASMASHFVDLWHGTMDCNDCTDSKTNWTWRVLVMERWVEYGHAVAACKQHFPGCFDVTSCNPAEKLNSFYKVHEFITWLYHLCLALLYGVLPDEHWHKFCKFIAAIHVMSQYRITTTISASLANGLLNGKKSLSSCIISGMLIRFTLFSHALISQTTWP